MLSVRLPENLEKRLAEYCEAMNVSKSYAVQTALEKHLKKAARQSSVKGTANKNPFLTLVGTGNGRFSTEQVMRMTRGEDWNKP
jgi:Ribbon-helix-helix protein, copG family